MVDPVKIVLAIPNEGMTVAEAYDNHMMFNQHLGRLEANSKREPVEIIPGKPESFEFYHFTAGRLYTPAAREALSDHALQAGMDYMFMFDTDMILPMDLFEKLYRHDVDIVAPLAFTRNEPHYPVLYEWKTWWDPVQKKEAGINAFVRKYPKNRLVQCDAVGFGAVLIKMDVVMRTSKPRFMGTCGTGEDVLFCYKAREQTDCKVYMDTSVSLGHLGRPNVITETYAEWYWKNQENRDIEKQDSEFEKYQKQLVCEKA